MHLKPNQPGAYQPEVTEMIAAACGAIGSPRPREPAEMIAAACAAIGLPRPREVIVTAVSAHLGVPLTDVFRRLRRKDGTDRRRAHAIQVFDETVRGPLLIAAGRHRGCGVWLPIAQ
jgi:CRISPR-associated protein Csb2